MKKLVVPILISLMAAGSCLAAEITAIRHNSSSENVRIVLDISEQITYNMAKTSSGIEIFFSNTDLQEEASHELSLKEYKILDALINRVVLKKTKDGSKLTVNTSYPVEPKVFCLTNPFRVVLDLPREEASADVDGFDSSSFSKSWVAEPSAKDGKEISMLSSSDILFQKAEKITDGLSLLNSIQKFNAGNVKTYALSVDLKKMDVMPVISVPQLKKDEGSIFGAFFSIFSGFFDEKPQKYLHFSKRTVSSFVKIMRAVAGINGSFFYGSGTPVGVLIVNRQIISSPLYNRTALIIYKNGKAAINSVKMEGYIKLEDGETLGFSGVNQPISRDQIMVYTPDYQITDPSSASTNIIVIDGKVHDITYGETKVPPDGFIISANGTVGEVLKKRFTKGGKAAWFFMASPPLDDMLHVIAGGPQLVYNGEAYITSKEENFRKDVAAAKAARTAVGITKNGGLLFVVVEKNGSGRGATLEELSELMIKLGAVDAMNLDGGGSSTMVVNGATLNSGAGRPVSNALVVRPKENL